MFLLISGLSLNGMAQTPLGMAFTNMKSSDPAVAKKAKDGLAMLLVQEMPTIEKDTAMLCSALSDADPYIRLQASGVLQTIVLAAPQHNQVVLACTSELITAAKDSTDRIRNNALFALAMNPSGPPKEAHAAFVDALDSANFRTSEIGAAGLIKERSNVETNHGLVEKALDAAPDAKHRLNLLYAISGSKVHSETLFEGTQKYLNDPNPDVQHAAIDAVAETGTDISKITIVMQNLEASSSASMQQKKHAQAVLNNLASRQ